MSRTLFTSESVCAGHPDKIADRISDAVLDEIMRQDPHGRVGVETVAGANRIALFGETNTTATVDFEKIVKTVVKELGYTNPAWGFSAESPVEVYVHLGGHFQRSGALHPFISPGLGREIF